MFDDLYATWGNKLSRRDVKLIDKSYFLRTMK